jgi:DNA-binding MarR family transcriptional regulator
MKKTGVGSETGVGDLPVTTAGDRDAPYLFGDLLAFARADWVRLIPGAVAERGYRDYRPTDAALTRLLWRRRGVTISRIGSSLGVSRQAARKLVDGLEQRGYASEARDERDARSVKATLMPTGEAYARAVVDAVHVLNHGLAERVGSEELASADTALRASIFDEGARVVAARIAPPPSRPKSRARARGKSTSG